MSVSYVVLHLEAAQEMIPFFFFFMNNVSKFDEHSGSSKACVNVRFNLQMGTWNPCRLVRAPSASSRMKTHPAQIHPPQLLETIAIASDDHLLFHNYFSCFVLLVWLARVDWRIEWTADKSLRIFRLTYGWSVIIRKAWFSKKLWTDNLADELDQ